MQVYEVIKHRKSFSTSFLSVCLNHAFFKFDEVWFDANFLETDKISCILTQLYKHLLKRSSTTKTTK